VDAASAEDHVAEGNLLGAHGVMAGLYLNLDPAAAGRDPRNIRLSWQASAHDAITGQGAAN
jgi:hypothetical protein